MSIPALPKPLTVGELIQTLAVYPSSARVWITDVPGYNFSIATGAFRVTPGGEFAGDVVIETRPEPIYPTRYRS
jgi:hypothetical protein